MKKIKYLLFIIAVLASTICNAQNYIKKIEEKFADQIIRYKYVMVENYQFNEIWSLVPDFKTYNILLKTDNGFFVYHPNGNLSSVAVPTWSASSGPKNFSNEFLGGETMDRPCYWENKIHQYEYIIPKELEKYKGEICFISKNKKIFAGNFLCKLNDKNHICGFIYNDNTKETQYIVPNSKHDNFLYSKICQSNANGTLFCGVYMGKPAIFQYNQKKVRVFNWEENGYFAGMNSDASILFGKCNKSPCFWIKNGDKYVKKSLQSLILERKLDRLKTMSLRIAYVSNDKKAIVVSIDSSYEPNAQAFGNDSTRLSTDEWIYKIQLKLPLQVNR